MGIRLASSYRYRKIKTAQEKNSQTIENEGGNSLTEFIQIITSQNAKEITRRVSYKSDYQIGETVEFVIGNYFYMAEFMKWIKPEWCKDCPTYSDYDNGFFTQNLFFCLPAPFAGYAQGFFQFILYEEKTCLLIR